MIAHILHTLEVQICIVFVSDKLWMIGIVMQVFQMKNFWKVSVINIQIAHN